MLNQNPPSQPKDKDPYHSATIRTLRLKPILSVPSDTPCAEAIELMRDKGIDQLPIKSAASTTRLVGLVTLGNLLSYLSSGRANANDPVEKVMFDFRPLEAKPSREVSQQKKDKGRKGGEFVEFTMETELRDLQRFFEWNSAAIVTERVIKQGQEGREETEFKPVAVVTKVDLLTWLVRQKR